MVLVTMKLAKLMPSFLLLPLFFLLASEKSSAVAEQCRSRGISLKPEEFNVETCALCYFYMHTFAPHKIKSAHGISRWTLAQRNMTQINAKIPLKGTKLTNGTIEVNNYFCGHYTCIKNT